MLVIAEKPKAANKIAYALSNNPIKRKLFNIPYYLIIGDSRKIYVAPAAGHLYGLHTTERGYPVFNYEWRPLYEIERSSKHTYKFLRMLEKLCREADYYVNACDYDIEGSVIGYLIIENLGDINRSYRVKFSSLTPEELRSAFRKLTRLDWEMIEAGLCRHELDWIWGINISRALMDSVYRVSGKRVVLSAGRVQTPTLKYVVENSVERRLFIPIPQYTLLVDIIKNNVRVHLEYKGSAIETKHDALTLVERLKREKYLVVEKYDVRKNVYNPPPAFNLGDLQSEAARLYGFSPYKTQSIAEKLYLDALISYPRTNSQKLPPTLNYRGIMEKLRSISNYGMLVNDLLRETRGILKPVQGPKEDPAHPAIYPTGVKPSGLSSDEWKIYDLIVRRFLAAFASKAIVEHKSVWFKSSFSEKLVFQATGQKILVKGWFKYYPFQEPEERIMPSFHVGEKVLIVNASIRKTYTKPPEKPSRIKILKWMENVGIGTEATRARIIELLFKRGYLKTIGGGTEATDIGLGIIEVIDEYFPELTSVKLTRHFEEEMEKIRSGLRRKEDVVEEARRTIVSLLNKFEEKKALIGELLSVRLGYLKPRNKCRLCSREEWKNNLCIYHYRAYEELKNKYSEWRKREGISWEEYLKNLKKLRSTGRWVKEVVEQIDSIA
ncbi:MAG: DNA topoisomerase I [Desulfurococcales archaeon ex4484_58]|nr:MAG: DNA topoisomerase I [Desulfurococcales archaeon ex4484_58]